MIKVNVFVREKKWKKYIVNPQRDLKNKIGKIKNAIPFLKSKKVVFSVLLAGNKEIKNLNKKFRNKNKITDILSFPLYSSQELRKEMAINKYTYLGDVILNYYKIQESKKKDFLIKFNKLWIHGLLHLIGHKHYKNKDFYKMNKLENKILNIINKNK